MDVQNSLWSLNRTFPGLRGIPATGHQQNIHGYDGLGKLHLKQKELGDEGDTGHGSLADDISDQPHIVGLVDIYSEAVDTSEESDTDDKHDKLTGYMEMDSQAAKDLDKRYREVMAHKLGSKHTAKVKPHMKSQKPSKSSLTSGGKRHKQKTSKHSRASDLESVKTEDFENAFHTMMVKQVAHVPITSFDQLMVESDLDTVRSQDIHDRFLAAALGTTISECSEAESTDALQGALQRALNGPAPVNGNHGNPGLHPSSYRGRRLLSSCDIPPPLWECDERGGSHHYPPRLLHHRSSGSSSTTFEEEDSLDFSRESSLSRSLSRSIDFSPRSSVSLSSRSSLSRSLSRSIDFSPRSSLSLSPGSSLSRSLSRSQSQSLSRESRDSLSPLHSMDQDGAPRGFMGLKHVGAQSWRSRKQVSVDRASVTTSNSTSTFDEVESLDLSNSTSSQDFDLRLPTFSHGLTYEDLRNLNKRLGGEPSSVQHNSKQKPGDDTSISDDSSLKSESDHHHHHRRRRRNLIEDENSNAKEELPFSEHVFNKTEEKSKRKNKSSDSSDDAQSEEHRRSLFDQLLSYKGRPKRSDSSGSSASVSTNFSEQLPRFPYENEYQYHVRRRMSKTSGGLLSRGVSMESTSSSFSSSSSPASDPFGMQYSSPTALPSAEDVLQNLGFCGTEESFIPERFARDWYQKTVGARQDRMLEEQHQDLMELESLDYPPPSHSTGHRVPPRHHHSGSKLHHRVDSSSKGRRARFRRSATVSTFHQDSGGLKEALLKSKDAKGKDTDAERQNSMDALKTVLTKQVNIFQRAGSTADSAKDKKRKAFASARQKSLPLWLDTLNEEEEGRISRGPSIDANRKSVNMRSFLEEEQKRLSMEQSSESDQSKSDLPSKDSDASSVALLSTSTECSDQEDTTPDNDQVSMTVLFEPKKESRPETWMRPPLHSIPSIVVSRLTAQSSSSLEIAEIMDRPKHEPGHAATRPGRLQVEPALVCTDILSSDNEESKSAASSRRSSLNLGDSEDRLGLPSVSPAPVSPVTVIELDHLDNQNDSLDSGDSIEGKDFSFSSEGELTRSAISLQAISEEDMLSSDQSRSASFDADSLRAENVLTSNSSVEADDGMLSPLMVITTDNRPSHSHNDWHSASQPSSKPASESAYESSEGEEYDVVLCELEDAQVQADDGTLSPIIMLPPAMLSYPAELPPDLCWVTDTAVQCDGQPGCEQWTQTGQQLDRTWQWSRSVSTVNSDGEPTMHYYMSESCQTEASARTLLPDAGCPHCVHCQPSVQPQKPTALRSNVTPHKNGKVKKDYVSEGRKALDSIIDRLTKKMEMRAKKTPLLGAPETSDIHSKTASSLPPPPAAAAAVAAASISRDSQATSSEGSFDKAQTDCIVAASQQVLASIDSFDLQSRRLSCAETTMQLEEGEHTAVPLRTRCGSLTTDVWPIRRNQSTESRRSSLQRQLSLDVFSQGNSPMEFVAPVGLKPTPEEDLSTAGHTNHDAYFTVNHSAPIHDIDKDKLAASIVTDLFQGIGTKATGSDQLRVLQEIELDYQVLRAVNRTLDRLLSGELSTEDGTS